MTKPQRAKPKTTDKSTVGKLIPQPHGGALRNGGTNKGGTGRPRDEWKAELAAIASDDAVVQMIRAVANDPSHPNWKFAVEFAAERGYGKEATPVEQSGSLALNVVIRSE